MDFSFFYFLALCLVLVLGGAILGSIAFFRQERLSRSILTNSGLGDLSVETLADYERMAVALAQDVDHLRDLRATLRSRIRAGALGRPDLFARDFYAMITAWVDEGIPQA